MPATIRGTSSVLSRTLTIVLCDVWTTIQLQLQLLQLNTSLIPRINEYKMLPIGDVLHPRGVATVYLQSGGMLDLTTQLETYSSPR